MTTTFGAEEVKKGLLGFGREEKNNTAREGQLIEKLKEYFSPEIINRLDSICYFNPLGKAELVKIAELELHRLNDRLKNHHTTLASAETVLEWLIEKQQASSQNAREVRRSVRTQVEKLVAEILLSKKINRHYTLVIKDEQLQLQ